MFRGRTVRTRARIVAVVSAAVVAVALPATAAAEGQLQIVIAGAGTGTVRWFDVANPVAMTCRPECSATGGATRVFDLTAVPAAGSTLEGWVIDPPNAGRGDVAGSLCDRGRHCVVAVASAPDDANFNPHTALTTVTARFGLAPPPPPSPREDDSVFLCYSRYQVDPGVWPAHEATALAAGGYWRPYAIRGASSSTRLGPYSLACNPPAGTTAVVGTFVDDGGDVLTGVTSPQLGLYPLAS